MTLRYAAVWTIVAMVVLVILMWPMTPQTPVQTPASKPAPMQPKSPAPAPTQASAPAPVSSPSTSTPPHSGTGHYQPTPEQAKDLRIAQLEAVTAQQTYAIKAQQVAQQLPEYQQFQTAMGRLVAECNKVKADNKWPVQVECDVNSNPVKFDEKK